MDDFALNLRTISIPIYAPGLPTSPSATIGVSLSGVLAYNIPSRGVIVDNMPC
jgi:hypothetical protein